MLPRRSLGEGGHVRLRIAKGKCCRAVALAKAGNEKPPFARFGATPGDVRSHNSYVFFLSFVSEYLKVLKLAYDQTFSVTVYADCVDFDACTIDAGGGEC